MKNILKTTLIASLSAMAGVVSLSAQEQAAAPAVPAASPEAAAAPAASSGSSNVNSVLNDLKSDLMTPSADKFHMNLSVGYEDSHVFRGKKEAESSFQASINAAYRLADALGIYVGWWQNAQLNDPRTIKGQMGDETDFTLGVQYAIAGFNFDLGYTYYWFHSAYDVLAGFESTNEIKLGVAYDTKAILGNTLAGTSLTPSLYYYHDFDKQANTLEARVDVNLPVGKWAFNHEAFSVDSAFFFGYNTQDRNKNLGQFYHHTNSYMYIGFTIDAVYKINKYAAIKGGIRWAANDDGDKYGALQNYASDNNVWYGFSATIGF